MVTACTRHALGFDDCLLRASLSEYDSRHAHVHCYLQHFLFTEAARRPVGFIKLGHLLELFLHHEAAEGKG